MTLTVTIVSHKPWRLGSHTEVHVVALFSAKACASYCDLAVLNTLKVSQAVHWTDEDFALLAICNINVRRIIQDEDPASENTKVRLIFLSSISPQVLRATARGICAQLPGPHLQLSSDAKVTGSLQAQMVSIEAQL